MNVSDVTEPNAEPAASCFKVPIAALPKKHDKDKAETLKDCEDGTETQSASTFKATFAKPSVIKPVAKKRPLVSFQPKSTALPAEVYKPHRPTATEFLQQHLKTKAKNKLWQQNKEQHDKTKSAPETEAKPEVATTSEIVKKIPEQKEKVEKKPQEKEKKLPAPPLKLSYEKPPWSCSTEASQDLYSLEVLRNGTIIDTINLKDHEFFLIGRLPECDLTMEHPSISRHHAILQFGIPGENDSNVEFQKDGSPGFYLYELGSTHGSFLNKAKVPKGKYYRIKVGHMIRFGNSTRTYIMQGPDEDQESETEETATELRDKAREERNKKKDLAKMMMGDDSDSESDIEDEEKTTSRKNNADTGISWGMLEEAVNEEKSDDEEKEKSTETDIFQEKKDPFYVKDPNKALKNFYDKEGIEIDFECNERRPGQWNVRLELPVDTPTGHAIYAEASVTGKRRDAMNNCALEACRILDKHGMFKQAERHQRQVKQWEKDDFYDSDEDQFLDRTGDLDVKRKQRKMRIGGKKALLEQKPETYETLTKQIEDLDKEVSQIEKQLDKDKAAVRTKQGAGDPLEEFMRQVKSGNTLDSLTRTKLKHRLIEARKESARLAKLAEIARPASMPPVNTSVAKSMAFIGKMKGKKRGIIIPPKFAEPSIPKTSQSGDDVIEVEEEEDEEKPAPSSAPDQSRTRVTDTPPPADQSQATTKTTHEKSSKPESAKKAVATFQPKSETDQSASAVPPDQISPLPGSTEPDRGIPEAKIPPPPASVKSPAAEKSPPRRFGPTLPPELLAKLKGEEDGVEEAKDGEGEDGSERQAKRRKRNRKREKGAKDQQEKGKTTISNDPDYCDWMPPQGQSGDGTTSLNAKFGY